MIYITVPIIFSAIAILIFFNWPEKIVRGMIIGIYVANHGQANDTLEIKSDGSYVLNYKPPHGKNILNKGDWIFNYRNGEPRLSFDNFIFGIPGYGSATKSTWDVEVESSRKKIKLCIDPDLGYFYEK